MNFNKLYDSFFLEEEQLSNEENLKKKFYEILPSTDIYNCKETDICLEKENNCVTNDGKIYISWYRNYKGSRPPFEERQKDDINLQFYILKGITKQLGITEINHPKWEIESFDKLAMRKEPQEFFYDAVLNISNYKNQKNKELHIYVMGQQNDEINETTYMLSNKLTFNISSEGNCGKVKLVEDKDEITENYDFNNLKTVISCNPDGTYEESLDASYRLYPYIKKEDKDKFFQEIISTLNEKPDDKYVRIDLNKELFDK